MPDWTDPTSPRPGQGGAESLDLRPADRWWPKTFALPKLGELFRVAFSILCDRVQARDDLTLEILSIKCRFQYVLDENGGADAGTLLNTMSDLRKP